MEHPRITNLKTNELKKSKALKGSKDILVIKLDKEGNILYTNVIGTENEDLVVSGAMDEATISVVTSSNLYNIDVSNNTISEIEISSKINTVAIKGNKVFVVGSLNEDAYIAMYTDNVLTWEKTLSGTGYDEYYSLALDEDGIYVVGQSETKALKAGTLTYIFENNGGKDGIVVKYNYNGSIILTTTVGGTGDDTFTQVITKGDSIIIAGLSSSPRIRASASRDGGFIINRLGDIDTLIITLSKSFEIEEGMNLTGSEGELVQEIGINQYTEQLMILNSSGVHTQKVIDNTFTFDVNIENGVLTVEGNEEIRSARLYDGTETYDINDGIEVKPGAYEVEVTSANGQTLRKVINVEETITIVNEIKVTRNILPQITIISASSIIILGLLALFIIKRRKSLKLA